MYTRLTLGTLTAAVLALWGGRPALAQAVPPGAPPPPPASASQPAVNALGGPAEVPPPVSEDRLEAALRPQPGGLRAAEVGRRAEVTSYDVIAQQRAVEAAQARLTQAALAFIPRITGTGRYARLSSIPPINLGTLVGLAPPGVSTPSPVLSSCPGLPGPCVDGQPLIAFPASFPQVLNTYTVQGTLQVPLSDYVLRLSRAYAAAVRSTDAARYTEGATRLAVRRNGQAVFYNWARARAAVVVADQAVATARDHVKDANAAFQVGTASKADVLQAESQLAASELLLERAQDLAAVSSEQLRVTLHEPRVQGYALGEDLNGPPPPEPLAPLPELIHEALGSRLEIRALDEQLASLRAQRRLTAATYYPRLDAFANLYYQNPNVRYFPPTAAWNLTWDAGVQLTWTLNDTITAHAQVREVDARAAQLDAQRAALADGIRLEVTQAAASLREAEVALGTTARQLQAAQESYRVRRDLFRAGRATSTELLDAETQLVRARLDLVNARIDARIARVSFEHALGRDVPSLRRTPASQPAP
jgi:outer membrane protein TolC